MESRHRSDEPGGTAAKAWLQAQLENEQVYLEFDQEKQDRYKRLLAHLYLSNGKHLNAELLANGLATVNLIPPNLRHAKILIRAQQRAEQQGLGIWSMPAYKRLPISQISTNPRGWRRYIGTPKSIKRTRKYTRLIFNNKANVRINNNNLNLFPALETYLGKPLEIRGWVSRKKDQYSILIRHPSALVSQ